MLQALQAQKQARGQVLQRRRILALATGRTQLTTDTAPAPPASLPVTSGLVAHFDANSVETSGGGVTRWPDQSGNNYHLEPPTGSEPVYDPLHSTAGRSLNSTGANLDSISWTTGTATTLILVHASTFADTGVSLDNTGQSAAAHFWRETKAAARGAFGRVVRR